MQSVRSPEKNFINVIRPVSLDEFLYYLFSFSFSFHSPPFASRIVSLREIKIETDSWVKNRVTHDTR